MDASKVSCKDQVTWVRNRCTSTPTHRPHAQTMLGHFLSPEPCTHKDGETGRRKSCHDSESLTISHKKKLGQITKRQESSISFTLGCVDYLSISCI